MKKIFIYTITFLLVQQVFSQQKDIIYFDQDWEKTTKENAEYYRFTPLEKKGNLFLLKDYYIDGNLQMEGLSSNANKSVYEGKVTWYYKNGNKSVERNYKAGSKEGLIQSYFEDGHIMSTGTYKNDCPFSGTFKKRNFNEFIVRKYEECTLIEEYSFYEKTKTIAERHLDYVERYLRFFKSIYYNEKGEVIGELPYKKANHVEEEAGTKVHFSYTNNATINTFIELF